MRDYILEVEDQGREVHVFLVDTETNERTARVKFSDQLWSQLFDPIRSTSDHAIAAILSHGDRRRDDGKGAG